ncbi:demethoxyubiquinone hydroxylase family protein [Sphingobium sp. SA2]|uniref:demethoxyubiquinone hydroxylase family protein n=1 Tax=Sphingobium sp. SA2 TaxID=1524832 RepID=UPI0028C1A4C7|nr:demethoxyubiquinone hydroxylase family protein [Sphingobium sp. SA2]MDT7532013.1 demethoxyubiquinone hydroxylase family protein [Sphingobium sp. SA2]
MTSAPNDAVLAAMVRVDHAGEFGAVRIYDGQLAILGRTAVGDDLRAMRDQECEHLATFADILARRRVRPTALLPLWHFAGFALGAATALMGKEAAMACTQAVEDSVVAHYGNQIAALGETEPDLRTTIIRIQGEEQAHGDHAVAAGAKRAPAYALVYHSIRLGCRTAIAISQKF